ncbi:MAG TPA: 30S ribosomal protein S17 [Candidatus Saccharimonadales bacterium]|nr:30S ribosomal protein S17 [Candidatus Saccharimonadales bacterium]
MSKTLIGKIVSVKMQDTVLVEVVRRTPHKLYGKLMRRSKKFKVAINGQSIVVGNQVVIEETKPVSKEKYFKVIEVLKEGGKGGEK